MQPSKKYYTARKTRGLERKCIPVLRCAGKYGDTEKCTYPAEKCISGLYRNEKLVLSEGILRIHPYALLGCGAEILFRGESVQIHRDVILRKDTGKVAWYLSHGNGAVEFADCRLVSDDTLGSFRGTKLRAYDTHACNWNQQELVRGAQYELTVKSPFCRRVGDSFWSEYQNDQLVKARLVSILEADKFSARIRW